MYKGYIKVYPSLLLTFKGCFLPYLDFETRYESLKPYDPTISRQTYSTKKGFKPAPSFQDEYMNLDEFILKATQENRVESRSDDTDDYPKPNVDLLASLVTLGRMIQDQKQIIKRQEQERQEQERREQQSQQNHIQPHSEVNSTYSICNELPNESHSITTTKTQSHVPSTAQLNTSYNSSICSRSPIQVYENSNHCSNEGAGSISASCDLNFSSLGNGRDQDIALEDPSSTKGFVPEEIKDIDYWERRKRNNMAAKKSREERRRKELDVLEAAKTLEKENSQLATMLKRLTARNELLESRLQSIRKNGNLSSSVDNVETTSTENSS